MPFQTIGAIQAKNQKLWRVFFLSVELYRVILLQLYLLQSWIVLRLNRAIGWSYR
jgi:hypothetical protein